MSECLSRFWRIAAAVALAAAAAAARADDALQSITAARFERGDGVVQPVTLPDTWARRGVGLDAPGRYHATFTLARTPAEPLALRFERLSTEHRISVNGHAVSVERDGPTRGNPAHPVPQLIKLPPALLADGENTLTVEVRYAVRAGLSAIEVGPLPLLRERHQRYQLLHAGLPQALNMAMFGLALFMLLVWWRRRSETALGLFGLLSLLGSVRNYGYFMPMAVGSAALASWQFYVAQVASVVLLGFFAQAFAGVRWPRYRQLLIALALVLPPVGALAIANGHGALLRHLSYPPLIAICLPALWLCFRRAREIGSRAALGQALGVGVLLGAGAHDHMVVSGALPVDESFWLPYAMPLALGAMAWALIRRMVAALTDVETLNAELEQRVADRTRELEQANAAKSRFLAAASHDLRQPMVGIGLLVGLAKDDAPTPQLRRTMGRLEQAVVAMDNLIAGLLDLSRLHTGDMQPRLAVVHVGCLFEAIEALERPAAQQKGLRLRFRPSALQVVSDPVMLERILRNLVSNAIRYTDAGGVLVAARRRGGEVRIEVHDTGIGIAREHQQLIFEEFAQLDRHAARGRRGVGLGLAIAKRASVLLGHRLALVSQPGRGSRFHVELPAAGAATSAAET